MNRLTLNMHPPVPETLSENGPTMELYTFADCKAETWYVYFSAINSDEFLAAEEIAKSRNKIAVNEGDDGI